MTLMIHAVSINTDESYIVNVLILLSDNLLRIFIDKSIIRYVLVETNLKLKWEIIFKKEENEHWSK